MAFSLTWLPEVLKAAGLKVALEEGWENRGHGDVGQIMGVICHHTAGPKNGNMPSLETLKNGRKKSPGQKALPGPLAQLGLARDGTFIVIAAGRAIHAGIGEFKGVKTGNSSFIGIEAENTGKPTDLPWPSVQLDAYQRGVAAILKKLGKDETSCCGHKEYALPHGRKVDPSLNMGDFRTAVATILNGAAPPPTLIPAVEPNPPAGTPARPTLRRGARGDLVKTVQAKIRIDVDGKFGPRTEAAVRQFQRDHDLVPDGIVGPKTWHALDAV
ncbi:MAG TPA: N-acetylmuramoyl-L-alanine amidase [Pyrinomonadaceae bacterium]|nr:N-acetylmuramoyl-L-alanine amidase [Pyrinomonadaceae bacterium]